MGRRRRLAALICTAALLASLTGCASVFDKEYLSVSEYSDTDTAPPTEADASEVRNYFGLKLAITRMVNAHEEQSTLNFRRYDGSISEDIASACREVSRGTALGDYCVDYIAYDLDRIVAYYEAVITVTYKRSAEEVDSIVRLTGSQTVYDALRTALSRLSPSVAIMQNGGDTDAESLAAYVETAWYEDPVSCVNKPAVDAKVYSGGGIQRIFEVTLDYGESEERMLEKSAALAERAEELAGQISGESEANRSLRAADLLLSVCDCDESAGSTAWDALVLGRASGEGVAAAYKVLCDRAGVDSLVVSGQFRNQSRCWNLISVSGDWYHADIFRAADAGLPACFLRSDAAVIGEYLWDEAAYPLCAGDLTYAGVFGEEPEVTPTPAQSPEPTPTFSPSPSPSPSPTPSPGPTPEPPSPTPTEQNT